MFAQRNSRSLNIHYIICKDGKYCLLYNQYNTNTKLGTWCCNTIHYQLSNNQIKVQVIQSNFKLKMLASRFVIIVTKRDVKAEEVGSKGWGSKNVSRAHFVSSIFQFLCVEPSTFWCLPPLLGGNNGGTHQYLDDLTHRRYISKIQNLLDRRFCCLILYIWKHLTCLVFKVLNVFTVFLS